MYQAFYGFRENPFNLTPDPRYLFLSRYHREALDHLLYGINERKGFIAITGGIGTGKTTLCRAIMSHLNGSTKSALIFSSYLSDIELLKTVAQEFGIEMDPASESKKDYIDALNDFLLHTFSKGGNALLLIDEAQNLSNTVLEQIRMLSNLETEQEKLIQIVLVGQSELKETLAAPPLRQLDERITVRYHLRPLDFKDIQAYVEHRLVVAGGHGIPRFTKGAFKKIYAYSRGNPRRINALCDRALVIGYTLEKQSISRHMIEKAISDLRGDAPVKASLLGWSGMKARPAISMIILAFLVGIVCFAGWNFRKDIIGTAEVDPPPAAVKSNAPPHEPPEVKQAPATLFLDEKTSLASLFELFAVRADRVLSIAHRDRLGLVSFDLEPKYHALFKKPFRVRLPGNVPPSSPSPRYLVIREVTSEGAIATDAKGDQQQITREFILKNWGNNVSWVYPIGNRPAYFGKGMNGPEIFRLQKLLSAIGYPIEPTGGYDENTVREVTRFQRDFGLKEDGIVGPRTMALLYQMET